MRDALRPAPLAMASLGLCLVVGCDDEAAKQRAPQPEGSASTDAGADPVVTPQQASTTTASSGLMPDASAPPWVLRRTSDQDDAGAWNPEPRLDAWTRTYGGDAGDTPARVIVSDSRLVVAGSMPQDPNASRLPPPSAWDDRGGMCFLAAFALDGSLRWGYRHDGCSQTDYADIAELPDGSIVATYEQWIRSEVSATSWLVETTVFKLDASGNYEWERTIDSGEGENLLLRAGPRIAASADGSFVLLSHHHTPGEPHTSKLTRYSADGEAIDVHDLPSSVVDTIRSTAGGDVLVSSVVDWESQTAQCVERLTTSFESQWFGCFSGEGWGFVGLEADSVLELASGAIAIAASPAASAGTLTWETSSTLTELFEPPSDAPATFGTSLVVVLDADGTLLWGEAFPSARNSIAIALSENADGDLFVGGWFSGPSPFLGVTDTSVVGGAYVAKFSATGDFAGARTWDGELRALASGPDDTLVATGSFDRGVDFGFGDQVDYRTPRGPTDGFIMRFPWSAQNRVLPRLPAQCDTLSGTSLPVDFEECTAQGFGSYRAAEGPICHAG